jgi:hypothetical protein
MYSKRFSLMSPPEPEPNATPPASAFVLCPLVWFPGLTLESWQQELYRRALEEAKAVVRPSILERDLLGVWN